MNNLQEKLKDVFEYFRKLKTEYNFSFCFGEVCGYEDLIVDNKDVRISFYKYILKQFNFDKLPIVESDTKFKQLNKIQLYHGFSHYLHCKEYLKDSDIFDFGFMPSGFYVTNDKEYASFMTSAEGKFNAWCWLEDPLNDKIFFNPNERAEDINKVLPLKLNTNKICRYSYIKDIRNNLLAGDFEKLPVQDNDKLEQLLSFVQAINDENERLDFIKLFLENYSNLAVLLGYDAMYAGFGGSPESDEDLEEEIEIFNRGIVVIPNSKYNYFLKMAEDEILVSKKSMP